MREQHPSDLEHDGANRMMYYLWLCDQYELKNYRQQVIEGASECRLHELTASEHFRRYHQSSAMDVLIARCNKLSELLVRWPRPYNFTTFDEESLGNLKFG
jgi:hypothetical protein